MAIFNNTADKDLYNEQPKLFTYKPEDKEEVSSLIAWLEEKTGSDTVATAINDERFLYREKESLLTQIGYRKTEAEQFKNKSSRIELADQKTVVKGKRLSISRKIG